MTRATSTGSNCEFTSWGRPRPGLADEIAVGDFAQHGSLQPAGAIDVDAGGACAPRARRDNAGLRF